MNPNNTTTFTASRSLLAVIIGSVLVAVLATIGILYFTGLLRAPSASRQAVVHSKGSQVMPFDLDKTTHIFNMTDTGGVQQVIAKDPNDTEQIRLIQQHVRHEAINFSSGNFSDPTALHGDEMPGLKDLTAGASKVKVEYAALPKGAQITFTSDDTHLITSLHQWFGAQLSDHGHDATSR